MDRKTCHSKSCKSLFLRKKIGIHGITSYATGQDILASHRNSDMNEEWNFPLVFHNYVC